MFSGIIEGVGRVVSVQTDGASVMLGIENPFKAGGLRLGDSVAVNGCCLTVSKLNKKTLIFQISPETLTRTTLSDLKAASRVNLERALQFSRLADSALGRVGGHLMTGHVDGVGSVLKIRKKPDFRELDIVCPATLQGLLVEKGSVAVDGVSLTVNGLLKNGFSVGLIRHTLEATTLAALESGSRVNLEADLIGKYVRRFIKE